MKVAIVGAGIGGATLYRLVKEEHSVDLFDKVTDTTCGQKPCVWGVNAPRFNDICKHIGVDGENYYLSYHSRAYIQGKEVKTTIGLLDKPRLLQDLIGDKEIKFEQPRLSEFDRVIDATGVRALLSPDKSCKHSTYQIKAVIDTPLRLSVHMIRGSVLWTFPLSQNTVHIGVLSLNGPANRELLTERIEELGLSKHLRSTYCSCQSGIWYGGLRAPFVTDKVWGLGETIGLVDPITGSGILPAMVSAKLLYENWNNPVGYTEAIRNRFKYIVNGSKLLRHFEESNPLPLGGVWSYLAEKNLRGLSLSASVLLHVLIQTRGHITRLF